MSENNNIMTIDEFEELKGRIEKEKEIKNKAKGAMESIETKWEKEHSFSTIEDAEKKENELKKEIEKLEKESDTLLKKIGDIVNEEEIE